MVGSGNGIDPSGDVRVARLAADGTWEPFGSDEGAPEGSEGRWPSLAVAGDTVLVSDLHGARARRGRPVRHAVAGPHGRGAARRSRSPSGRSPTPCSPSTPTRPGSRRHPWSMAPPWLVAGTTLSRHRDGAWDAIGPVSPATRPASRSWPRMAPSGRPRPTGSCGSRVTAGRWSPTTSAAYMRTSLAAGDEGSVWTILDGDVVAVRPDGSRTPIGRPGGSRPLFAGAPLAAGPGVVWTSDADPKRGVVLAACWDWPWSAVGVPEPYTWVSQLLVAADGAVWATLDAEDAGQALARYADGGGRSTGLLPVVWRRPPRGRCAASGTRGWSATTRQVWRPAHR